MSELRPFLFEQETLIRVLDRDGEPWFVATDVCRALGVKNPAQAVEALDEDERGLCSTYTLGGNQGLLTVSEGGLYTLVLRSRGATTPGTLQHRFRKWVTSEVLPAIRRTGRYQQPEAVPAPAVDVPALELSDSLKLRKVTTAMQCFGRRAGAQMWMKVGLEIVPAMQAVLAQPDFFEVALEIGIGD